MGEENIAFEKKIVAKQNIEQQPNSRVEGSSKSESELY
jgi:hypothetical protein